MTNFEYLMEHQRELAWLLLEHDNEFGVLRTPGGAIYTDEEEEDAIQSVLWWFEAQHKENLPHPMELEEEVIDRYEYEPGGPAKKEPFPDGKGTPPCRYYIGDWEDPNGVNDEICLYAAKPYVTHTNCRGDLRQCPFAQELLSQAAENGKE